MALLNILEAVNKTLEQQLENDKTVVVFGKMSVLKVGIPCYSWTTKVW